MPDAGVLATILLIVGLFLLALELMIPSFGMIGILSAISLLIAAACFDGPPVLDTSCSTSLLRDQGP